MSRKKIFSFSGDNDKTVPVSRSMVAAAKVQGTEIKYLEIPGGDHVTVTARAFKNVFDWLDAHRRKTADEKAAAARARSN